MSDERKELMTEELRLAQFRAAFPGVGEMAAFQQKERRAEWIRNNVGQFRNSRTLVDCVNGAENLADELIKRGYL